MKKRLMISLILALSLALSSWAQAAWPPSSLAFQWGVGNNYTILSVKLGSSIRMADGVVKFYQLSGIYYDITAPSLAITLSGMGYVGQDGVFVFSLNGSLGSNFYDIYGRLQSTGVGNAWYRSSSDAGWGVSTGSIAVTMVLPKTLPRP